MVNLPITLWKSGSPKRKIFKRYIRKIWRIGCHESIDLQKKVFSLFWDEHRHQPLLGNLILLIDNMDHKILQAQEMFEKFEIDRSAKKVAHL